MNQVIKSFALLFTSMILIIPTVIAQNDPFTGKIVFDVKTDGNIPEMAKFMTPTKMTYRFSADKQSMTLNFQMADQKTIYIPFTKEVRILMNIFGQKLVINQTSADLDVMRKQQGETIGVKETNETKTIAGYLCRKTIITKKTSDGKENASNVYSTDAIDVSKFKLFDTFPEVKGFPLEFSMKSGQVEFTVIAQNVNKESVPASEFEVGSDYKKNDCG